MKFLWLLLSLLLPSGAFAETYTSYGPLPYRTMNPLYLQFLQIRPERARVEAKGKNFFQMILPYTNIFEQNSSRVTGYSEDVDMEVFRPSFLYKRGLGQGWEVSGELAFMGNYGGFLDGFVQDFHKAFGFPNGGRDLVENGRFAYNVSRNGRALTNPNSHPFRPSDLTLQAKLAALEESDSLPALSARALMKIPLAGPGSGLSSGRPDFGLSVDAEKNYKRLHGYLNTGMVVYGGQQYLNPLLNIATFNWLAALEVTAVQRYLSVLVQTQGSTPLYSGAGFPQLDSFPLELVVGFSGSAGPIIWQAAFGEDPNANGPSADFTAFVTVGYRL